MDRHELGHCTDQLDHVRLLDGGTLSERVIGFYCGVMSPFTVLSSGRDMMVQFRSDRHTTSVHAVYNDSTAPVTLIRRGFHASFSFQRDNETTLTDDSSRYVDVGAHSPRWNIDDWITDEHYIDDTQGNGSSRAHAPGLIHCGL